MRVLFAVLGAVVVSHQGCGKNGGSAGLTSRLSRLFPTRSVIAGVDNSRPLCQVDLFTQIEYCTTMPNIIRTNIYDGQGRILQTTDPTFGVTLNTIEVHGGFSSANPAGETDYSKMLYNAVAYNGGNAVVNGMTYGYCVPIVVYESPTLIKLQVPMWDYNTGCDYFISHRYVHAARTGSFSVGPVVQINSAQNLGLGDGTTDPTTQVTRSPNSLYLKLQGIFKNFSATDSRLALSYQCQKNGSPLYGAFSIVPGTMSGTSFEVGVPPNLENASCRFGIFDQRARPTLILMDINTDMSSVGINTPIVIPPIPESVPPSGGEGSEGGVEQIPPTPFLEHIDYAGVDPASGLAYIVIWGENLASGDPAASEVTLDCATLHTTGQTYSYISSGQINGAFTPLTDSQDCEVTVTVNGRTGRKKIGLPGAAP